MAAYDPNAEIMDEIAGLRAQHVRERSAADGERRMNHEQEWLDNLAALPADPAYAQSPIQAGGRPGDVALGAAPPEPTAPVKPVIPSSAGTSLRSHAEELKAAPPRFDAARYGHSSDSSAVVEQPQPRHEESMDELKKRLGFSWGNDVELNSATGRPTTSTVVHDQYGGNPVQANEAEGPANIISPRTGRPMGPSVSYPGGNTDDDYLRYRSGGDPLELAGLRLGSREAQTALDRAQIGPAAPATAGENLQDQRARASELGSLPQLDQEYQGKVHAIDAAQVELELWKAGKSRGHQNQPITDGDYQRYAAKLAADREQATEEYRLKLAATHKGSATGLAPRY